MKDREILLSVRKHAVDSLRRGFQESNERPLTTLEGYMLQTLKEILSDCDMRTCDCGRDMVDGTGIMCTQCWFDSFDGEQHEP